MKMRKNKKSFERLQEFLNRVGELNEWGEKYNPSRLCAEYGIGHINSKILALVTRDLAFNDEFAELVRLHRNAVSCCNIDDENKIWQKIKQVALVNADINAMHREVSIEEAIAKCKADGYLVMKAI